jgi:hypothetical protein
MMKYSKTVQNIGLCIVFLLSLIGCFSNTFAVNQPTLQPTLTALPSKIPFPTATVIPSGTPTQTLSLSPAAGRMITPRPTIPPVKGPLYILRGAGFKVRNFFSLLVSVNVLNNQVYYFDYLGKTLSAFFFTAKRFPLANNDDLLRTMKPRLVTIASEVTVDEAYPINFDGKIGLAANIARKFMQTSPPGTPFLGLVAVVALVMNVCLDLSRWRWISKLKTPGIKMGRTKSPQFLDLYNFLNLKPAPIWINYPPT